MSIRLYYSPNTRAGRVRWLLEELGAPHELVVVDREGGECQRPEYLEVHPLGKVPALSDGDLVIYESSAILMHLADRFPDKELAPSVGSPERALYYQWMVFGVATVEPAALSVFTATDDEVRAQGQVVLAGVMGVLRDALEGGGPYLLGASFSAADVLIGSGLLWGRDLGWLEGQGVLEEYAGRLAERPAYVRSLADAG
jgi:glutathione S-transferase